MSGYTFTTVKEEGEETEFKCLAIGHFFYPHIATIKGDKKYFKSWICVKTGKKTAFNLSFQRGFRIKSEGPVKRIHEFSTTQTIED